MNDLAEFFGMWTANPEDTPIALTGAREEDARFGAFNIGTQCTPPTPVHLDRKPVRFNLGRNPVDNRYPSAAEFIGPTEQRVADVALSLEPSQLLPAGMHAPLTAAQADAMLENLGAIDDVAGNEKPPKLRAAESERR